MGSWMEYENVRVRVPGKLIVAGEYAVLESGQPSIVVGINRYVTVEIRKSKRFLVSQSKYGVVKLPWSINGAGQIKGLEDGRFTFIRDALTITLDYLKERNIVIHPFHIKISSNLDDLDTGKKYGLGSSAAVVVGTIGATLDYFKQMNWQEDRSKLYKLAILSHLKTQGNGSGIDIAAAVYGGWIYYTRYDITWVKAQMKEGLSLTTLIAMNWPNMVVEQLKPMDELALIVGWTQKPAKTGPMVNRIDVFKNNNPKDYEAFLDQSKKSVTLIMDGINQQNTNNILNGVGENRKALKFLANKSKVEIETNELTCLCDIGDCYGVGKLSGAGGGDCGIAILFEAEKKEGLISDWIKAGIIPLDLQVSEEGIHPLAIE